MASKIEDKKSGHTDIETPISTDEIESNDGILYIIAHGCEKMYKNETPILHENVPESENSVMIQFVDFGLPNASPLYNSRQLQLDKFIQDLMSNNYNLIPTMAKMQNLAFSEQGKKIIESSFSLGYTPEYRSFPNYHKTIRSLPNLITIEKIPEASFDFEGYPVENFYQPEMDAVMSPLSLSKSGIDRSYRVFSGLMLLKSNIREHQRLIQLKPNHFLNLAQFDHICEVIQTTNTNGITEILRNILETIVKINTYKYFGENVQDFDTDDKITLFVNNGQHIESVSDYAGNKDGYVAPWRDEFEMNTPEDISSVLRLSQSNPSTIFIHRIGSNSLQLFMHYLGYSSINYVNKACRVNSLFQELTPDELSEVKKDRFIINIRPVKPADRTTRNPSISYKPIDSRKGISEKEKKAATVSSRRYVKHKTKKNIMKKQKTQKNTKPRK